MRGDPLTPMPSASADPGDVILATAVKSYIADRKGPANARYEYTRVDLNRDGMREGLVLFTLPHGYWCGWSGCTMAVFQGHRDGFSLLSEINGVRGPVLISEDQTSGWRDIVVRVSGTHMSDRNVAMKFDQGTYPINPMTQTDIQLAMKDIPGARIFP